MQRLRSSDSGRLSSHSIISRFGLCATSPFEIPFLSTTYGPDPEKLPGFWGFMVLRFAPIPRKGLGNKNIREITSVNKDDFYYL